MTVLSLLRPFSECKTSQRAATARLHEATVASTFPTQQHVFTKQLPTESRIPSLRALPLSSDRAISPVCWDPTPGSRQAAGRGTISERPSLSGPTGLKGRRAHLQHLPVSNPMLAMSEMTRWREFPPGRDCFEPQPSSRVGAREEPTSPRLQGNGNTMQC